MRFSMTSILSVLLLNISQFTMPHYWELNIQKLSLLHLPLGLLSHQVYSLDLLAP